MNKHQQTQLAVPGDQALHHDQINFHNHNYPTLPHIATAPNILVFNMFTSFRALFRSGLSDKESSSAFIKKEQTTTVRAFFFPLCLHFRMLSSL